MTGIREFQEHIAELYLAKDERRGVNGTMLWMVEEMGELAEAVRRKERIGLEEEMADVLAWLASLANLHGIDLQAAVAAKYPAHCKRCLAKPCACPEVSVQPL